MPKYQYSVIVGLLLSDGSLFYAASHTKSARLSFEQSYGHIGYLLYVFSILSHYCSVHPYHRFRSRSKSDDKQHHSVCLTSRGLSCFSELYSIFYINKVKIIPENIYELLTPVALAYGIQGDGQPASNGLRLCTDSYSVQEVVKLMNVLILKYRLVCTLHMQGGKPRIYISAKSMSLLSSIVKPFMCESMLYKLRLGEKTYKLKDIKPKEQKRHYSIISNKESTSSLISLNPGGVKSSGGFSSVLRKVYIIGVRSISNENLYIKDLGSYLAGLFEGDGHISISKPGSKVQNLSLSITFHLKELPLAERLKDTIGFG